MPVKPSTLRRQAPRDQAHGLRQMFAAADVCLVPLVHNPRVVFGGVVMERLCTAMAERGLRTLVVDAADTASPPHELAPVDLAACIETLSDDVSYLAARGLPMHYLDSRATTTGFLRALLQAAPQADVVLLHAGAADLRRMFAGSAPRPVLLVGDRPDSLTEAYGAMKLLSQRLGALSYDVVIAAQVSPRRARQICERLAECADHFLGAAVGHCAVVDPAGAARAAAGDDLHRLAVAHLQRSPASASLAAPRSAATAAAVRQGDTGRLN